MSFALYCVAGVVGDVMDSVVVNVVVVLVVVRVSCCYRGCCQSLVFLLLAFVVLSPCSVLHKLRVLLLMLALKVSLLYGGV